MMRYVATLAGAYALAGVLATTGMYLLTGTSQFHGGWMVGWSEAPRPWPGIAALVTEIECFLLFRCVVIVIEGVALAWCVRRSTRAHMIILVGILIAVLAEVVNGLRYSDNWVEMLWAIAVTSRDVPEYLTTATAGRIAAAHLGPAALAGLAASACAVRMLHRDTAQRGESATS